MIKERLQAGLVSLAHKKQWDLVPPWKLQTRALVRHLTALFDRYKVDLVLDVGANQGQYRDLLRDEVGFKGQIVSFEPVGSFRRLLEDRARDDPRWHIVGCALGARSGKATINVTKSPGLNSLLAPRQDVVKGFWASDSVVGTEEIEVRSLDGEWPDLKGRFAFERPYLKLDTQGFDLEVLKGSARAIQEMTGYQSEASVRPIYEGMPTYIETLAMADQLGYDLSGMFPVSGDEAMRLIEFDCVFVNRRWVDAR